MEWSERRNRGSAAKVFKDIAIGAGFVGALAMALSALSFLYDLNGFGRLNERNGIAQAQIEKAYDLKLTSAEFVALNYPQTKPSDDFTVYGSIQKDLQLDGAAYRSAKLSLVWSEGKFYLSESTNGEDFQPLSAKR